MDPLLKKDTTDQNISIVPTKGADSLHDNSQIKIKGTDRGIHEKTLKQFIMEAEESEKDEEKSPYRVKRLDDKRIHVYYKGKLVGKLEHNK